MFSSLATKLTATLLAPLFLLSSYIAPAPEVDAPLGALPNGTALFETSLASPIQASSTSMTLASASIRGGTTLSGSYCFTIDEGSAQSEFVCGTASGTAVTGLTRGISPADGTSEVASLKFSHRRGASVKITTFPLIQRLKIQNSGEGTYDSPLVYDASVTTSTLAASGQNVASVAYANSLSFGAVAQANETTGGFTELATGLEAASSTLSGTVARLSIPTSITTSSAPTSGRVIPVTKSDGNLDTGFLPDNFGSTSIRVFTANTTWTKPTNLRHVIVEMVGGGAKGGDADATDAQAAGGGGSGGYAKLLIPADDLPSSVVVQIGAAATSTTVGNVNSTIFTGFATATAGTKAPDSSGSGGASTGGSGGTSTISGVATYLTINGQKGSGGFGSGTAGYASGAGGSNPLGFGGGGVGASSGTQNGNDGVGYGSGGSGGGTSAAVSATGGAGKSGVLIVTEYF